MRWKILLVVLSALFRIQPCLGQMEKDCIVVHFSDDSYVIFPIKENPKITFDEGVVQISTERFQLSNVKKYTLERAENVGVEGVLSDGKLSFSRDGSVISLSPNGKVVKLFSVSGIEIPVKIKDTGNGKVAIDLGAYSSGVYMLTVGNESIKITKQ